MTVYLDHAATTPMRPEAVDAMQPFLAERFGNPSGVHAVSRAARVAVDEARDAVADALGAQPGEIVFTGSGTEADNLAILGVGGRSVCTAVEHHAVLHAVEASRGVVVPVDANGVVDLDALARALDESVAVVSVILANNETGVVQPLADVIETVRRLAMGAVVHTDAVQAVNWLDVAQLAAGADMVSISAHKFGGPQGVGVLVVRDGVRMAPIIHGGGQERDRRSGTHNVAGIVGLAAALTATVTARDALVERVGGLRDRLLGGILGAVPGAVETAPEAEKVAGTCHVMIEGVVPEARNVVESEPLLLLLDDAGVCASAGSACASGAMEPSHVLSAMGVDRRLALSSLRLSLGWTTTDDDVDLALKALTDAVARLRGDA